MALAEEFPDIVVGRSIRKTWGDAVVTNIEDLDERLSEVEGQVGTVSDDAATAVFVSTTELTDAQIKALPTTAISLIDAPAGNQRIKIHNVTYTCYFEHGAYTNVDTDDATLEVQTTSGARLGGFLANDSGDSLTTLTTLFASAVVRVVDVGPYATNVAGAYIQPLLTTTPGLLAGNGVQLAATNNGAGNFTGGHTSNRLTVQVYYSVEATATYQMPFAQPFIPVQIQRRRPASRRSSQPQSAQM